MINCPFCESEKVKDIRKENRINGMDSLCIKCGRQFRESSSDKIREVILKRKSRKALRKFNSWKNEKVWF